MKKNYILILLCIGTTFLNAQTVTYYSKPDTTQGKNAEIWSLGPDTPMPNSVDYIAADWTWTGNPGTLRSLMQFDLSSIPAGATIIDASLSLHYNPTSSSNGQAGNNASYLRRITSTWNRDLVTWNTAPTYDTTHQVLLAMSDSVNQNYLNIDVKNITQDMVNNSATSFGFLFMEQLEATFSSMKFASFAHADTSLHPSLLIHYSLNPCITLNTLAKITNAKVWSINPTTNLYADPDVICAHWTWNATPGTLKSLLKVDLSSIPLYSTIQSATLSLYYNTLSSSNGQQGTNASYLQLITSAWSPTTVTWNTQPSTSTTAEVLLPMSTTMTEDYPGIDVTNLISNLYQFPNTYYGIELNLQDSVTMYSAMKFFNESASDTTKTPKLVICYTNNADVPSVSGNNNEVIIYPNPSNGEYSILYSNKNRELPTLEVINVLGQVVYSSILSGYGSNLTANLDLSNQPNGMYLIRINNGTEVIAKKVVKE